MKKPIENPIYQLKIGLSDSEPLIWRRLIVTPSILLSDLHYVIQIAMGWEDEHMHQFFNGKPRSRKYYSAFEDEDIMWNNDRNFDYTNIVLSDFIVKPKDILHYEYDFGDSWYHDIVLEKLLESDLNIKLPICLEGENACPPEDCGGVGGYEDLLEIVNDPKHEDYQEMRDWLGIKGKKKYDPTVFNVENVNKKLWKLKLSSSS